ncbi:sulfate adenylyltransferase [Photobacterium damselae subsp. damselae]|uniref:Sulfate adenylyltransferase n=1 Tax=Photobacterium damselae subsp. damselae TaxID=85581 RepID=A0AAD3WV65_PHODD|nr:sulfate adenylyltransferase [Photobacterium damselae subsp. damselae]PSW85942.1 sulfate adenylyltransferase [Photobacterium damselae]KAB1181799.1 sulfate adenylyltransferase [Photobacterium damselae subsp. damselae]KAB1505637.1 sulfate adenylyltransferase [Photobacterium damselae subsp. damselae]PSB79538.1 sulfate adenylyltransferase [Photobacterium damselae subsp. damselae]
MAANVDALTSREQQQISKIRSFYGERAEKRATAWRELIDKSRQFPVQKQLKLVNDFFNQFIFVDDIKLWGKKDYWATPLEFVGVGAGDCEDFSIAKYMALRSLGVPDSKLRLVYVKSLTLNQFHMVVAYYPTPTAVPEILDNLDGEIKPANKRKDLLPIYSFNGSNLWLIKQQGQGQLAGKASRLSMWNDLRHRNRKIELHRPKINFDE